MRLNLAVFRADGVMALPMGVRDDQDGELSRGRSFGSERVVSEGGCTGTGNPTGGKFAKEHPRRNEVNTRVENQRERINQGLKNGKLTGQEAQQLRVNDRAIKQQEHADVKGNGGSLRRRSRNR